MLSAAFKSSALGVRAPTAMPTVDVADSFAAQWPYVSTTSRFNVLHCSRRAGKTHGEIRRACRIAFAKPGARILYIALVRKNARKHFFEPLREFLAAKGVPCEVNEVGMTVLLANGSYIECDSCDDIGDVPKFRGDKWDLVIVDEAQEHADEVISSLIDNAILPSLVDRKGSLDISGTPPPGGPVGYLYEVVAAGKFTRYHWTLFDNPHIDPNEIAVVCEKRGLTPEHPIYRREFLGEFCVDTESLVYEYEPGRNDCVERPMLAADTWRYSMGVDLGFSDRDAICVLGWRKDDPDHKIYEAWSWQKNHLDVDQLAEVFVAAVKQWRPQAIIGDTGGHGAVKVLKSLQSRLHGYEIAPKPASLLESIALVNDELRTGRLFVDPKGPIAHDARLTTWAPGKLKQEVSDSYHSDILDAMRYAHHGAQHWRGKTPKPPKSLDQIRMEKLAGKKRAADIYAPQWSRVT